jgi:hypothetical protein
MVLGRALRGYRERPWTTWCHYHQFFGPQGHGLCLHPRGEKEREREERGKREREREREKREIEERERERRARDKRELKPFFKNMYLQH